MQTEGKPPKFAAFHNSLLARLQALQEGRKVKLKVRCGHLKGICKQITGKGDIPATFIPGAARALLSQKIEQTAVVLKMQDYAVVRTALRVIDQMPEKLPKDGNGADAAGVQLAAQEQQHQ